MVKKKFKKVVEWHGTFKYITMTIIGIILFIANVVCLITLKDEYIFMYIIVLISSAILIALGIDKLPHREVYYEEM